MMTGDMDLNTRVKPVEKRAKGGGKNWVKELDSWLEEEYDDDEEEIARHGLTGE